MKLQFSEFAFSPQLASRFEQTCWRPRTLASKRAPNPNFYIGCCTRPCRNGPPGTQTRALQMLIFDICWAHLEASKTLPGTSKRKKRTREHHTRRENKKQTTTSFQKDKNIARSCRSLPQTNPRLHTKAHYETPRTNKNLGVGGGTRPRRALQ